MVTVCAMVATLMQALDNTIANVALPYIQGSLRPPPTRLDLPSGGAQVRLDRGSPSLASGLRLCSSCSTGGSSRIGHSTEIIAELVVACLGIYLFIVHLFTSNNPAHFPGRKLRDGLFDHVRDCHDSAFEHGSASPLFAEPRFTGLLMAPRGLGTMLAMVLAGRLTSRVDPRLLMSAGILMICASMWSTLGWTPDVDAWSLALTTFTQGVGLGFVFYPAPGGGFRHL